MDGTGVERGWQQSRRLCVAALVTAAAIGVTTAVAAAGVPYHIPTTPQPMTATLSSSRANARPVVLTLKLQYPMQCGLPGPGTVTVVLPEQERGAAKVAATAVLVDGTPATSLQVVEGRVFGIRLPQPPQVMCDVIGPGTLTIQFTRAVQLANPAAPGVYLVRANLVRTNTTDSFHVRFRITPR